MAGFVEEVTPISECLDRVTEALRFPWTVSAKTLPLSEAVSLRAARTIRSEENNPPFTRSLRDGYAVDHRFTTGASSGAPVFLRMAGEIFMGAKPVFSLGAEEVASIPTGGMMPDGADAVVMLEDTADAGKWIEVRKAVQRGENIVVSGEDIAVGDVVASRGDTIDCALPGMLSTLGFTEIDVIDLRIAVISTGDEIVSAGTSPLPLGFVRDANTDIVRSTLRQYGFSSRSYGIVSDHVETLKERVTEALSWCDVLLLSGGSSVGVRDHTTETIQALRDPGLLIRGINMLPGKPTLIGGSAEDKKIVVGLPGHPTSCMVACLFVVLPLLLRMVGAKRDAVGRYIRMPLEQDVQGRTGPDEFIPMRLESGGARPLAAKSGYVSAMRDADGFIRMTPDVETLRQGEEALLWLW
ncbi:molybdopterin molybdotransferase MoeA [Synergistaceae bacterium OttesenSCG-928-I11]|nr:molybdopterin molybdotransferase MoeA [Synergistaceae bacterium OttesenSCG-928-I11]